MPTTNVHRRTKGSRRAAFVTGIDRTPAAVEQFVQSAFGGRRHRLMRLPYAGVREFVVQRDAEFVQTFVTAALNQRHVAGDSGAMTRTFQRPVAGGEARAAPPDEG